MSTSRLVWIALAVFAAVYLLFLGVRPLIVPDEHRYAAIGLEMIDRGDFTVPRLIGFRYFEKPAGGRTSSRSRSRRSDATPSPTDCRLRSGRDWRRSCSVSRSREPPVAAASAPSRRSPSRRW